MNMQLVKGSFLLPKKMLVIEFVDLQKNNNNKWLSLIAE